MEEVRPKYEEKPKQVEDERQEWDLSSDDEVPFHIPRD